MRNEANMPIVAAKIIAGLGLIALLLSLVGTRESLDVIKGASFSHILAAALMLVVSRVLEGTRLFALVRRYAFGLAELVRVSFVAAFISNFMPTSAFGEGYRAYYLRDRLPGWNEAIGYILVDKLLAFSALICAFVFSVFRPGRTHPFVESIGVSWNFLTDNQGLLVGLVLFVALALALLARANLHKRLLEQLVLIASACKQIMNQMGAPMAILVYGFAVAGFAAAAQSLVFIATSVGVNVGFFDMLALVSVLYLSAYIPLTFGGLGVREGVVVFCLMLLGVQASAGLSIALLSRLLTLVDAGLGGLFLFAGKMPSQTKVEAQGKTS